MVISMRKNIILKELICIILASFSLLSFGCAMKGDGQKSTIKASPNMTTTDANYMEIKIGPTPFSPTVADFNQDGFNDIAVVSHGESNLQIYWGGTNHTFNKGPTYGKTMVGYHPGKLAVIDWDNDGLEDIILACEGIFKVQFWKNTGTGFEKKAEFPVNFNAKSIQCTDFDNDGLIDIVLGPHEGHQVLVLWRKNQSFTFNLQRIDAGPMTENVETGDWNLDGKPDIFWVEKKFGAVVVALNQGHKKFEKKYLKKPERPRGVIKDGPEYVKLADLDGDSCIDAAVTLEVGKACLIYYGNCSGGVKKREKIPAPAWGFSGLAAVGMNSKHESMLGLGEELKVFIGKRVGGSWKLVKKPAGSLPRDLSFVDIDDDGILDLIFSNAAQDTVGILWGPF